MDVGGDKRKACSTWSSRYPGSLGWFCDCAVVLPSREHGVSLRPGDFSESREDKAYYLECGTDSYDLPRLNSTAGSCCNACATAFCSPSSGRCYDARKKHYYIGCTQSTPAHTLRPKAARFQFRNFSGCSATSHEVGHASATSAHACEALCEASQGCMAFLFGRRHGSCGNFLGSCHLYTSCFPENNPCWGQYLRMP